MSAITWGDWEPTAHLKFDDGVMMQLWRRRGESDEFRKMDILQTDAKKHQQVQWRPVPGQNGVTNQSKVYG